MSECRVPNCMAHVAPNEKPPAAHFVESGSTSKVSVIQFGTSAERYVSALAIRLSMHNELPDGEPLGSTTTTTGATPSWLAENLSRWLRSAPPVNQSAGPPGWPENSTRTGRAGRGALW